MFIHETIMIIFTDKIDKFIHLYSIRIADKMYINDKLCIMLLILSVSSGNLFNDNQTIVVRAGSAAYPRYLRRNLHGQF